MINQQVCPFCRTPAMTGCEHLAVAAEGRDFVRRCVELCQGEKQWRALCEWRPPAGAGERGMVAGAGRLHLAGDGVL